MDQTKINELEAKALSPKRAYDLNQAMKSLNAILAIKKLFAGGKRWTKGAYARDINNRTVPVIADPKAAQLAHSFCLLGTAMKLDIPTHRIAKALGYKTAADVMEFNDSASGWSDIKNRLDKRREYFTQKIASLTEPRLVE